MPDKSATRIALTCCLLLATSILVFRALEKPNPPPALPVQQNAPTAPALPVVSATQLPPHALEALTRLCGNCSIADSNAAWRSTDVIIGDSDLPTRRFTSIDRTDKGWDIRYERGGFASSSIRLLLSNDPAPQVLPGSSCEPAPDTKCYW